MPKRKRDHDLANSDPKPDDYRRQRQIVHTFEESAKQLSRAFKLAKGFERQKLGRRRKQAANDTRNEGRTQDLERIDAEIATLKVLDPLVVAEHYLAKSLLKIKAVATPETGVLPTPVREAWAAKAGILTTTPSAPQATTDGNGNGNGGGDRDAADADPELNAGADGDEDGDADANATTKTDTTPETTAAPPKVTATTTLNVSARLCNSNPVKEALPAVWAGITRELGVEVEDVARAGRKEGKKKRLRKKDFEEDAGQNARKGKDGDYGEDGEDGPRDVRNHRDRGKEPRSKDLADDTDDSEDEFAGFADRLALASDDEAGTDDDDDDDGSAEGETSDLEALERQLAAEGLDRTASSRRAKKRVVSDAHDADPSLSSDDDVNDESDLGSRASSTSSPPPPTKPRKLAALKNSMFLPSLTMGGYISGSGSDLDDDDDDIIAPRKNRRGQRARQKIWEKKFGSGAKHLRNQERNQGWDPRRGATDGKGGGGRGGGNRGGARVGATTRKQKDTATGANAFAVIPKATAKKGRDDGGSLHPSWQAAKKAKLATGASVRFQGTKISFD